MSSAVFRERTSTIKTKRLTHSKTAGITAYPSTTRIAREKAQAECRFDARLETTSAAWRRFDSSRTRMRVTWASSSKTSILPDRICTRTLRMRGSPCCRPFKSALPDAHFRRPRAVCPIHRNPGAQDPFAFARFSAWLRQARPDVVHEHGSEGGVYARLSGLGRMPGAPIRAYTRHGRPIVCACGRVLIPMSVPRRCSTSSTSRSPTGT
jgi:hypothetical protein